MLSRLYMQYMSLKLRRYLLLCVLIILGCSGNYLKFEIFFNVDIIFGSIFAFLILQHFGLRLGIFSAAIISSITLLLWSHPYAIIIMTCEVAAVALIIRRWKINFVTADIIYWLCFGMLLVYIFYHEAMQIPMSSTLMIMLKQALNGIINALIARIIYIIASYIYRSHKIMYREAVFNSVALALLASSLLTMAIESRNDFAKIDQGIMASLSRRIDRSQLMIQSWLDSKLPPLQYLATLAKTESPALMQPRIELMLNSQAEIVKIGLLDKSATIVAYAPLLDELGNTNLGKNFAEREYLPVLKKNLKPMLSEVVMGKLGVPKPIVTLLVPIVKQGTYAGYMVGVLNFDRMNSFIESGASGDGMLYTLTDRNNRVIVSNRKDLRPMDLFSRGKGEVAKLNNLVSQWIPPIPQNSSVMERWRSSLYISERPVGYFGEWTLIMEQPVGPFQKLLYAEYSRKLMIGFIILLIALFMAELLSRRLASSIEHLGKASSDLPSKLVTGRITEWPDGVISETARLSDNFRTMELALHEKFSELSTANLLLEDRVAERTRELSAEMDVRRAAEMKIMQSLREKELLLKEIHHRVKNNMQVISSLLSLQANKIGDPTLRSIFEESQQRVRSMALVHEKLYQTENLSRIYMYDYMTTLAQEILSMWNMQARGVTIETSSISTALDIETAVPCALILNELITNACKYAFPDGATGTIRINFYEQEGNYILSVSDNGVGISELSGQPSEETLGLQLVSVLARQLQGSFSIVSDHGTVATVTFPSTNKGEDNGKSKNSDS